MTLGRVYHVTLDPTDEAALRRTAGDPERIPEQTVANVRLLRSMLPDWSARIDNSSLTPEETLTEIAQRIAAGHGEITALLPDTV